MTLFILSLFLFSIFFTFDNKPINLLLDFIGIILSISFYLILYSNSIYSIDLSFFSYIFIIIYGSALAILFAFILMLFSSKVNSNNLPLPSNPSINTFLPLKLLFNSNLLTNNNSLFFNKNNSNITNTNIIVNNEHYNSFFFTFIKLYIFPILLIISFSSFFYFFFTFNYSLNETNNLLSFYNDNELSLFLTNLVNYIFNSFLFNPFPLILIINILLLGLIGAVFLLII